MMKKYLYVIASFLLLSGIAYAYYGGSSGVMTDTNCNQAQYFNIGVLCQDADDGKLYKGTGSAIEQIQAYDADLDTWAGITPSTDIQDFLGAANATEHYRCRRAEWRTDRPTGHGLQLWAGCLSTLAGTIPSTSCYPKRGNTDGNGEGAVRLDAAWR